MAHPKAPRRTRPPAWWLILPLIAAPALAASVSHTPARRATVSRTVRRTPPKVTPAPTPVVPGPDAVIAPSELKPGMKGYGLTVFKGAKVERFDVTVLGVLPAANLGKPLV